MQNKQPEHLTNISSMVLGHVLKTIFYNFMILDFVWNSNQNCLEKG